MQVLVFTDVTRCDSEVPPPPAQPCGGEAAAASWSPWRVASGFAHGYALCLVGVLLSILAGGHLLSEEVSLSHSLSLSLYIYIYIVNL